VTVQPDLFLLAVDHRRSFEQLFGIDEPVRDAGRQRMVAAKSLVAEALGDVVAERGGERGDQLGILIDDVYGGAAIEPPGGQASPWRWPSSAAARRSSSSNTPTGETGSPPLRRRSPRC
jgi:myo-inositol catabolism protein IolC